MCGWFFIGSADRPSIPLLHHIFSPLVDHRLNGKYHPRNDLYSLSTLPVVWNFWLFMKIFANSMPHQLPYDAVSEAFNIMLNRMRYISDPVSDFCLRNRQKKGLVSAFEQKQCFFVYTFQWIGIS